MMISDSQLRGVCGELRDLKRRYPVLIQALGTLTEIVDALIPMTYQEEDRGAEFRRRFTHQRNRIVRDVAAALGTTPEKLAGGLLPEED